MTTLHGLLVNAHIVIATIALLLFWVPAIARKGSPLHVSAGRVYAYCMYAVTASAFVASLMVIADPLGIRFPDGLPAGADAARAAAGNRAGSLFLLMLSVLVFASVRHGMAALRERTRPGTLSQPAHRALLAALAVLAVISIGLGLHFRYLLLIIFVTVLAALMAFTPLLDVYMGQVLNVPPYIIEATRPGMAIMLLALAMLIYYNLTFVQFQGRYLFVALLPFALTLAAGVDAWRTLLVGDRPASGLLTVAPFAAFAPLAAYLIWRVIPGAL